MRWYIVSRTAATPQTQHTQRCIDFDWSLRLWIVCPSYIISIISMLQFIETLQWSAKQGRLKNCALTFFIELLLLLSFTPHLWISLFRWETWSILIPGLLVVMFYAFACTYAFLYFLMLLAIHYCIHYVQYKMNRYFNTFIEPNQWQQEIKRKTQATHKMKH